MTRIVDLSFLPVDDYFTARQQYDRCQPSLLQGGSAVLFTERTPKVYGFPTSCLAVGPSGAIK
jgi:hypothetical protein